MRVNDKYFGLWANEEEVMPSCFRPAGFDPITDTPRFTVAPRYTCGSPGLVRSAEAARLARDEEAQYSEVISGLLGEEKKAQAMRLGLSGIVEERWEFQGKRHFRDLITDETGLLGTDGTRQWIYGKGPVTEVKETQG
jgi:hypothetical protein